MHRLQGFFALVLISAATVYCADPNSGSIRGIVLDQTTKERLAGAHVLLGGSLVGASTDTSGRFVLENVPVGPRSLTVRMIGYESVVLPDVLVTPGRASILTVELRQSTLASDEVTVTAGYFRTSDVASLGSVGFNAEEIRRSPGSANDVSRILMALPSVAAVSDNANDLAVRGGSPMENAFFVDGIPIPNINHFPAQGSTGGPIGMLNIDFIDNVDLFTSGFSSAFGDRLSSVIDIRLREGNAEAFFGKAFFNFAGFGAMGEGPLPGTPGSWMLSANKSYLDLLVGAIGTGAAPRYGDLQGKASLHLHPNHTLTILDVFGQSEISFSKEDADDGGQRYYGENRNLQNTLGSAWRAVWGSRYTSLTSLSVSTTRFRNDFRKMSNDAQALRSDNLETNVAFRSTNDLMLGTSDRLQFGWEYRRDEGRFDYHQAGDTNRLGLPDPDYLVKTTLGSTRTGAFLTAVVHPMNRLALSLGMRVDHYPLSGKTLFGPRFSASFALSGEFTVTASTGHFYQQNPLIVLSSNPSFSSLAPITASHYAAGVEYMLRPDTKLTVDVYDKEYGDLPLSSADPTLSVVDNALFNQRFSPYQDLHPVGKAYTRGVEVMVQKKMAEDFYGLISAAFFRSRYRDFHGVWRDRIYDNKLLFSVIGGYRPERDWEASVRWTYAGGGPYTPFDPVRSSSARIGVVDDLRANEARTPSYHSLNLRIDKKYYFDSHLLDVYLSVWNAYNRKNVAQYYWNNTTNAQDTQYQWSVLPVVGVEYSF
jgi:outer membrane receptor for ferrienterochelin and colicin